jgi:hypothetical protein
MGFTKFDNGVVFTSSLSNLALFPLSSTALGPYYSNFFNQLKQMNKANLVDVVYCRNDDATWAGGLALEIGGKKTNQFYCDGLSSKLAARDKLMSDASYLLPGLCEANALPLSFRRRRVGFVCARGKIELS